MAGILDRLTARLKTSDYIIRLKAAFVLRICIGGVIVTPVSIGYTIYINLNNPVYGYSIYWEGLAPLIVLTGVFAICILALNRGYFSVAAHTLFIVALSVVWVVILIDKSSPVGRLDTIVVMIALLSMGPLIVARNGILIPLYSAVTVALVILFGYTQGPGMGISYSNMVDFIMDTGAAAIIIAIISYNLFSTNRQALEHSEDSKLKLSASNKELAATNEELAATNEELEAAMEELTATNEEFEAQNLELIKSQEAISDSLEEKIVMLKEIHHRVKNNMQIVSSLLNLQSLNIENPAVRQIIQDAVGRIHSMALIHEKIYRADNFSQFNMAAYLNDLADEVISLYSSIPNAIRVDSDMEQIYLPVDQAVPCGILINEVLTNAMKHGCRDVGDCRIDLSMSRKDGMVTISIADSGPGMDPELYGSEKKKTMGLQIIEALAQQLNAELRLEVDKGTRFTIRFMEKAV